MGARRLPPGRSRPVLLYRRTVPFVERLDATWTDSAAIAAHHCPCDLRADLPWETAPVRVPDSTLSRPLHPRDENKRVRRRWLQRLIWNPPLLRPLIPAMRRFPAVHALRARLLSLNSVRAARPPMDPALRSRLRDEFRPEIERLDGSSSATCRHGRRRSTISEVKTRSSRELFGPPSCCRQIRTMRIGGIASFIRSFVRFAPDDFELSVRRRIRRPAPVGMDGSQSLKDLADRVLASPPRRRHAARSTDTARPALFPGPRAAWPAEQARGVDPPVPSARHVPALRWTGAARLRFVHLSTTGLARAGAGSQSQDMGSLLRRIEHDSLQQNGLAPPCVNSAVRHGIPWAVARAGRSDPVPAELLRRYDLRTHPRRAASTAAGRRRSPARPAGRAPSSCCSVAASTVEKDRSCSSMRTQRFMPRRPDVGQLRSSWATAGSRMTSAPRFEGQDIDTMIHMMGTPQRPRVNQLMNVNKLPRAGVTLPDGPDRWIQGPRDRSPGDQPRRSGEIARMVCGSRCGSNHKRPWADGARRNDRALLYADWGALRHKHVLQVFTVPQARAVLAPVPRWHQDDGASG